MDEAGRSKCFFANGGPMYPFTSRNLLLYPGMTSSFPYHDDMLCSIRGQKESHRIQVFVVSSHVGCYSQEA